MQKAKMDGATKVRAITTGYTVTYLLSDNRVVFQNWDNYGNKGYGQLYSIGKAKDIEAGNRYMNKLLKEEGAKEVPPYSEKEIQTAPKGLNLKAIFAEAETAALAAGNACKPAPMLVFDHVNPMDDASPVAHVYAPVMDGVCGFAYVYIKPANSEAAKYAVDHMFARKSSESGVFFSVQLYNQSYERKSAYAHAFAEVLKKHGITCWTETRMD